MLKWKLIFSIICLHCLFPNLATDDLYSKFHQKDFKLEFQRIELEGYNKSVWNRLEIRTFKYNRTLPVVNVTLNSKINMSTGIEMKIQVYKFLNNQYRIMPGTRFQLNFCRSLKENIAGFQILLKCGNFTKCEVVQDKTYALCNIYPDGSRFPPYLPNGEFRVFVEVTHDDVNACNMSVYIKIYRPIIVPGH